MDKSILKIDYYGKEIKGTPSSKINDDILKFCLSNAEYKAFAEGIINHFKDYAEIVSRMADTPRATEEFLAIDKQRTIAHDIVIDNINQLNRLAIGFNMSEFLENAENMHRSEIGQEILIYCYLFQKSRGYA